MTLLRAAGQRRSPIFSATAARSEQQNLQQLARTTSKPLSLAATPVGANNNNNEQQGSSSHRREDRASAASLLFSFWREPVAMFELGFKFEESPRMDLSDGI
uniref:Uncharacterized protein n=1 Tax=Solanum tuberosum TaxID=4113 RepID=M1ACR7_SOLTU